jgi:hypothetical protein
LGDGQQTVISPPFKFGASPGEKRAGLGGIRRRWNPTPQQRLPPGPGPTPVGGSDGGQSVREGENQSHPLTYRSLTCNFCGRKHGIEVSCNLF